MSGKCSHLDVHQTAMLKKVVDLLPAPSPRMMFAHQLHGVDSVLIVVRVLSVLIEALSQIRTVKRHFTQGVGWQKRPRIRRWRVEG